MTSDWPTETVRVNVTQEQYDEMLAVLIDVFKDKLEEHPELREAAKDIYSAVIVFACQRDASLYEQFKERGKNRQWADTMSRAFHDYMRMRLSPN